MDNAFTRYYPTTSERDAWLSAIWEKAVNTKVTVIKAENPIARPYFGPGHIKGCGFLLFSPEGRRPFYVYWQPVQSRRGPLLIHLPGGGAEFITHPDLTMRGYNILDVNPLGLCTPDGRDAVLWGSHLLPSVMVDTYTKGVDHGYGEWLVDCVIAVEWARRQSSVCSDRFAFFGTSQGGFGSLLMSSLYHDKGACCTAAEEPFAADFACAAQLDLPDSIVYNTIVTEIEALEDPGEGYRAMGYIDIANHIDRLDIPVLLLAGGSDILIPYQSVKSLYEKLTGIKSIIEWPGHPHDFSPLFINMTIAWFDQYL